MLRLSSIGVLVWVGLLRFRGCFGGLWWGCLLLLAGCGSLVGWCGCLFGFWLGEFEYFVCQVVDVVLVVAWSFYVEVLACFEFVDYSFDG